MGQTRFLTRRLENIWPERALNVYACNIKRMISLVGIEGLLAATLA